MDHDLLQLFSTNAGTFGALVATLGPRDWTRSTPCADWDVHALVNHVVGEQFWAPHLVAGETVAQVGDRYDGDLLGDDGAAAWRAGIELAIAAFGAPGALERTVHLSYGDEPCRVYLTQMITDLAVHGWDLAQALERTDHRIDAETVEMLWATWQPLEAMVRGSGVFGEAVGVAETAPLQDRLLGYLGRRSPAGGPVP